MPPSPHSSNESESDRVLAEQMAESGKRWLRGMGVGLLATAVASILMAAIVITDAYHQLLFGGFAVASFIGGLTLLWGSVRRQQR